MTPGAMLDSHTFVWPIRVYYEDTDAGGVVYHSNYINFLERARTEWLRFFGLEQDALMEQGVVLVVSDIQVKYLRAARFNQLLHVHTRVLQHKGASVVMEQKIVDNDQLIVQAKVVVATVNPQNFRPIRIPQAIKEVLERV